MTSEEWDLCDDAEKMIGFLAPAMSDRKITLLFGAVTEADSGIPWHPPGPDLQWGVRRLVAHLATKYWPRGRVAGIVRELVGNPWRRRLVPCPRCHGRMVVACDVFDDIPNYRQPPSVATRPRRVTRATCPCHNGFVAGINRDWLLANDGLAARLAKSVEESAEFDRLPVLADALLDAGCDDDELLEHLREGATHYPGCWALDAVLGKE